MQPLKIKLSVIGQCPPDLIIDRIMKWKSDIWCIEGAVESFDLSHNADLDNWGFSDEALAEIAPPSEGADFTLYILNVPLEGNFYSRRLAANVVCFSFYEIADILRHNNIPIGNAVLRMIYSYCLIYKRSKATIPTMPSLVRFTHDESRGCIFDMNGIKADVALSCQSPILCESCKANSLKDGVSREFLAQHASEIALIKKDVYFQIADWVKKHPIISILISISVAFLVNIASSFAFEYLSRFKT